MDERMDSKALIDIIKILEPLDEEDKIRVLNSVLAFLNVDMSIASQNKQIQQNFSEKNSLPQKVGFSENISMSPKEFLLEKKPKTAVEKIACLAYYLTYYRDMPHFKTNHLSELNTEAAQPKFTNIVSSAKNALSLHYLAASSKGQRQLSAMGEQFVQILPDYEAAKLIMKNIKPRKKRNKSTKNKSEK